MLDQDVAEPDPQILALNAEMVAFDETAARYHLRAGAAREARFVRAGLGRLMNAFLVGNAALTAPMNRRGCGRMRLNVLVLQQNLKNVEEGSGAELRRAARYFELFELGPEEVVEMVRRDSEKARAAKGGEDEGGDGKEKEVNVGEIGERFTYDELKALLELCYSEQLADPERGVAAAAKRQLADKLLGLSEYMWQS